MSKVERKEYHETKVMRTMSPTTRYVDSTEKYDNNLDHLLADLQNTVSRPNSSMTNGNVTRETRTVVSSDGMDYNRNRLISHVKPSNPMTEYSSDDSYSYTDPDGTRHIKTVKKETYSYKTSGDQHLPPEKVRMQNNINKLDSLLDDLQQVKQSGAHERTASETRSHHYSKQYVTDNSISTRPERTRSLDRSETNGNVQKVTYRYNEGNYGDLSSTRAVSTSPINSTLSKQSKITKVQSYPVEVVQTTTPDINPEILASLDPELLPSGNTKVTTTIKTYTYEIPGNAQSPPYSPNHTITTPSKSFTYNKYEDKSLSRSTNSPYPPSTPPPDKNIVRETITTRNYQPQHVYHEQPGKKTYIYNENVTTRNFYDGNYPQNQPHYGHPPTETYIIKETHTPQNQPHYGHPPKETYIIKETHTTSRPDSPDHTSLPPVTTTIHKFDSMTNLNARHYPEVETFDPKNPPYPYHGDHPPEVNVTYKYKSTTNTSNNYRGAHPGPGEDEPLLPRRFPTEEVDGPPKKLDDLMATIGNEPPTNAYNSGWKHHEEELAQQRKIDSLKAQHEFEQQKEDKRKEVPKTKNVSGPPVYYPPGHEMFARKEESRGAWRAEGGMAKEKGKYMYEAESRSKSKSSSGAAIVPVCLPLCCGLPCTII